MLETNGWLVVKPLGDGRYAAIAPMAFTYAIIVGKVGDEVGYDDRWCYKDAATAIVELHAWNGVGEPEGWHRHPRSGRRKDAEGNEYVRP